MNNDPATKFLKALRGDAWMRDAACGAIGAAGDQFFAHEGMTPKRARLLCQGCPVKTACAQYALDNKIPHGVWGGMTESERSNKLRETFGDRRFLAEDGRCRRGHGPEFRQKDGRGTRCMKCKSERDIARRAMGAA